MTQHGTEPQHDLDVASERPFDRRRFLGGVVTTGVGFTGLVAGGGVLAAAAGAADPVQKVGIRLGPDGLPLRSVAGTFIGMDGDAMLVRVNAPIGVVRVTLTPTSQITGHGTRSYGDASLIKTGDWLNAGTAFDSDNVRSADYVEVNMWAGVAWITAISSDSFDLEPAYSDAAAHGAESFTAMIEPHTRFNMLKGARGRLSDFNAGDAIHFLGHMDTPEPFSGMTVYAGTVSQSDTSRQTW